MRATFQLAGVSGAASWACVPDGAGSLATGDGRASLKRPAFAQRGCVVTLLRVVFVCTANIARSAYAERRLLQLLGPSADVEVSSAGMPGYPGRPMDEAMAAVLERRGGSAAGHVSRTLSGEQALEADLILTMELRHHILIVETWPATAEKCFGLGQFADSADRAARALPLTPGGSGKRVAVPEPIAGVIANVRPDSMTWDVPDPHKRERRAYRRCADTIDAALERIVPVMAAVASRS